jgi:hypothetical protein
VFMSFFIHKKVRKREIYHCHYGISSCHSNCRMLKRCVSMLCNRLRTSNQSVVSVCLFYSVVIDNILMWKCEVSIMCKGDCLRLTVCGRYSWEMAIQIGLDASFDNT